MSVEEAEDQNREATNREDATLREHSFNELARVLASGAVSRQRALWLVVSAVFGGLLASIPGIAWTQTSAQSNGGGEAKAGGTTAVAQKEKGGGGGSLEYCGSELRGEIQETPGGGREICDVLSTCFRNTETGEYTYNFTVIEGSCIQIVDPVNQSSAASA